MAAKNTTRNVYTRLIGRVRDENGDRSQIMAADSYVDEALDLLTNEEPGLLKWLQNSEHRGLMRVNLTAVYNLIRRDSETDRPFEETLSDIDKLIGRMSFAVAANAALRERSVTLIPTTLDNGSGGYLLRDE